jgi:protein tyrosine phosphatase
VSLLDNRQFDQVLLSPAISGSALYIFSAQEVDFVSSIDLCALLTKVCVEHENWPAEVACQDENVLQNNGYPLNMYVPYDYNLPSGPYINASVITSFDGRKRIATQEPLTFAARCRFWRMVEEENVSLIVRAREFAFGSYFPIDSKEPKLFGTLSIELQETIQITKNATLRKLKVGSRIVSHLQIDWLDNEGFLDMQELLTILERIDAIEREAPPGATCIHCGAGVGRTGTIFGALFLYKRHLEMYAKALFNLDALLYGLRQWRMWMIVTDKQLRTLLNLFKYLQSFIGKA